jgi:hypothetical protein
VNDIHNHEFDKELDGHLVQGRLKLEEMNLVAELTRNLVPHRNIMSTMKERDPYNVTNKKQIYNARHRLKKKERCLRNEILYVNTHIKLYMNMQLMKSSTQSHKQPIINELNNINNINNKSEFQNKKDKC